ncbi:MAG: flagellar basal body rod protein [Ignavibacteria bacterium]|nr:flagellar basal body rod protein [Ignavibacteria bacterium]
MLKEFFTAALGMLPQQTRLEVIANNMANANTAGFKRESVFERNLIDARANFYNVKGDVESDDPPIGSYIDFENGAFQQTDNPLDLAIDGKGFFVLQDEQGSEYYTRSGHFRLSTDGTVTAMDGKMLMTDEGPLSIQKDLFKDPEITKDSKSQSIKIAENGEVFLDNTHIGTVLVANIEDMKSLDRISNQNFIPTEGTDVSYMPAEEIRMKQGWLEGSNVDIIREMVSMIELQRVFEAGSKVIHTNDSTLDSSIKLGRYY